jgi:hypothetical protein
VAVDFPVRAGEGAVVGLAPLVNCVVRGTEAVVGAEVRCRCNGSRGCCGKNDIALFGERSEKLYAYFDVNGVVPVDRDVATGLRLLGSDCVLSRVY